MSYNTRREIEYRILGQIEHKLGGERKTYRSKNNPIQIFDVENSIAHKVMVNSNAFFRDFSSLPDPIVKPSVKKKCCSSKV
jgi:hypothetical protein